MTRIVVYPADYGGCGHYRMIWPAEALRAQGADVHLVFPRDPDEMQVMATWWHGDDGRRTMLGAKAPPADIVVMQRPLTDTLADAIPQLQAQGVRVVVEIDDDFESIHPQNASYNAVHPGLSPRRNWQHLRRACEQANLVVCSTPALAGVYGRHGRVAVVPNLVPESYQWIPRTWHEGVTLGWSGSIQTHPDDLQVCGGGVAQAVSATDAAFWIVGTGQGVQRLLGLEHVPLACGWKPIDVYPSMLAELDVGMVPLALSRFNAAKSALKLMEMASVGTPAVVSPTPENRRMHALGLGVLAAKPKDWARHLRRLLGNQAEREDLGEHSRSVMMEHTIEGNCGRWLDAWSSAVNSACAV